MKISRPTSVLLSALVLIGGANVAVYAANGNPFILGHVNKETKPSVLKNTGTGPALKLNANGAPLAVNNSKKVRKLNADKVDGKNAGQLTTKTYVYELASLPSGTTTYVSFPGLPQGKYLVTYRAGAYFGGAGTYVLSCYYSGDTSTNLGTYGVNNGLGHVRCTGSGALTIGAAPQFTIYSTSTYTGASGTSQWTFTRINQKIDKTPGTSQP